MWKRKYVYMQNFPIYGVIIISSSMYVPLINTTCSSNTVYYHTSNSR